MSDTVKETAARQNGKKPRLHAKRSPKVFKEKNDKLYPLHEKAEGVLSMQIDMLTALCPLLIWAVYLYGARPLVIVLLSAVFCLGLDISAKAMLKRSSAFDLTPVITGIILALGLPPSAPLWLPVFGAIAAVIITHVFGGVHKTVIDPAAFALTACFLLFPSIMSAIPKTEQYLNPFSFSVSGFLPAEKGALETVLSGFLPESGVGTIFFGMRAGTIGEMSAFLIFAGLIYLTLRKIYRPLLPIVYLATVGIIAYLEPSLTAASDTVALNGSFYNMLDTNTTLCAVYMAASPATTPKTTLGKVIAGAVAGAVTVGMRYYVRVDISALCGILVINLLTPLLDMLFKPAAFGGNLKSSSHGEKAKAEAQKEENASTEEHSDEE